MMMFKKPLQIYGKLSANATPHGTKRPKLYLETKLRPDASISNSIIEISVISTIIRPILLNIVNSR
jgi:hypothetical protein